MAAEQNLTILPPVWLAAGLFLTLFGPIMMRPTYLAFALCFAGIPAFAQPAPQAPSVPAAEQNAPVPDAPPSQEEPRTIVTEKWDRGRITGATVTQGNRTYHLRPNTQAGSTQPGDAQSSGNRAAQWQIFQFDWQRQPDADQPPAPPPAAPQN